MKIYGIDFTSAPGKRKPVTLAVGELRNKQLTLKEIHAVTHWEEFETFLNRKGPWMAGMDFPFGLPGSFLSTVGLPHDWKKYVSAITRRPRVEFENKIKKFKSKHASPYKEPLRLTDVLASAQSPLKLVNAPTAKMFYEGARRILNSGASILPCRPKNNNRIILETYPALLARRYAGSYKSESKDSPAKKAARKKILEGILSDEFQSEFGFSLSLSEALKDRMVKDARGDLLDAVLCSLQAAWAWRQGKPGYGIPGRQKALLRSEGWIVDPSLNLEEAAPKLSGSDRGSTQKASENEAGNLLEKLKKLTDISLALSAERNLEVLLEMIMDKARELTHADGGTLYILEANKLHFKIFQNDTLGVRMGGESQSPLPFPPLEMNESNVSSYVAMTGHTVNIPDVKKHTAHNFSGPRLFDKKFKYKTRSMLLVPMKNQDEEIIGVIQLLNARKGPNSKSLIPFSHENVRWIQSLASQAAVAITHVSLVEEIRKTYSEVALARDMAMDANAAKSKFLANMTHELRTPMNAIIGYSEMLMEETLEQNLPEIHADLEKITRSAKMLLDLINDILDLSKIEAGKMDIHLESFKIQEVIDSSIHNIEPLANQNKNTLKIICPDNLGYMVADMTRVRQALINLLSNACKFTEGGQVALEVKRIQKDGTAWIFFSVSDTGIGIPQEKIRSIFSEFTQADSTITRKFGGTGLGLAISQRFCRMMGGHITADSEVNQGSTFTMKLPVKVIPFTKHPRRRASDIG